MTSFIWIVLTIRKLDFRFASEIESDPVGQYTRARAVLQELEIAPDTVNDEDLSSLRLVKTLQSFFCVYFAILFPCRYVCECVSRRASFMASAGITALLKKMDYKDVIIAIDGSLFRFPSFIQRPFNIFFQCCTLTLQIPPSL